MKLIKFLDIKHLLKGTILLFLFLLNNQCITGQKYHINIISDSSVSDKILKKKSFEKTFKNQSAVYIELTKIRSELHSIGYIAASYDSIVFDSLTVNARLYLGKKYYVNRIDLISNDESDHNITRFNNGKIKEYEKNPLSIRLYYQKIINELENNGFPFATIIPENVSFIDSVINISIKLHKNEYYSINQTIIKGNSKISPQFINRYLSLYKGDSYDESNISKIHSKLNELGFVSIIRNPELEFYDHKADVYLYLNKKKANLFNGIIGFFPDEENDNKLSFTGDFNLEFVNNLNNGENIYIKWIGQGYESQKLNTGIRFPYLLKTPFGFDIDLKINKKDTSWLSIDSKFGISFSFRNNDKIRAYYLRKNSMIISDTGLDSLIFSNSKSQLFGLGYFTENIDYKYNPTKGFIFESNIATGSRKTDFDENQFYEADVSGDLFIPLFNKFVLKLRSQNKFAFSEFEQYENELYKIGGFNTLRGFSEDVFSASEFSIFSLDLRYLYEINSNVYVFSDVARYRYNTSIDDYIKYPIGIGIGTNLSTKAGIFSISYALGKIDNQPFKISSSRIHIGYVNRF